MNHNFTLSDEQAGRPEAKQALRGEQPGRCVAGSIRVKAADFVQPPPR